MTVSALATRLGVSKRTVVRYAQALSAAYEPRLGRPLLAIEGQGAARAVALKPELLEHEERSVFRFAALRAAVRLLTRGSGSVLGDSAQGAVAVLRETLAPRTRTFIERADRALCYVPFGPKDLRLSEAVIDELFAAIIYRRSVAVTRQSRGGEGVSRRSMWRARQRTWTRRSRGRP